MQKKLENQIRSVEEKVVSSEPTTDDVPPLEEKEIKEILHELLNELYYSKAKKTM
jgi:hypothetical protein